MKSDAPEPIDRPGTAVQNNTHVPVNLVPSGEGAPVAFWRFPLLAGQAGLVHGVFSRKGGVSQPPFDSLNVGLSVGDTKTRVETNRLRIRTALGGSEMVAVNQVHGRDIRVIAGDGRSADPPTADAVITDQQGHLLMIQTADCQAVILYDPLTPAVGVVHSGWRGSVLNIVARTVRKMHRVFGTRPGSLMAAVGPSLGPCCAEFVNYREELPPSFRNYKTGNHFDFWSITRDQLLDAGVQKDRIEIAGICTVCRSDLFFSYRAARQTGRFATVAGLG